MSAASHLSDAESFKYNARNGRDWLVYSNVSSLEEPWAGGVKIGTFTGGDGCYRQIAEVSATTSADCNAAIAREIVRRVECHEELLAALKEAQETLLYNGIDTGHLPGISQRIRYAIAKAEGRA